MLLLRLLRPRAIACIMMITLSTSLQRLSVQRVRQMGARQLSLSSSTRAEGEATREYANLIKQAEVWCGLNGLMYTDGKSNWSPAPVSLCPNAYPKKSFEYTQEVQLYINTLVDRIARDRTFLLEHLRPVAAEDAFLKRLVDIFEQVPEEVVTSAVHLGIHRSDYMLNSAAAAATAAASSSSVIEIEATKADVVVPLQVEINTIASSFGCLSRKVGDLHRHLLLRNAAIDDASPSSSSSSMSSLLASTTTKSFPSPLESSSSSSSLAAIASNIPDNPTIRVLAFSIALAHFLYGNASAVVLFVVQPGEKNIADQRLLEAQLWSTHGVRCEFVTLAHVALHARLEGNEKGGRMFVKQQLDTNTHANEANAAAAREFEVSVAYYRAGYSPDDYPSELEWQARTMIERSSATKCPNVAYQLAGTKKIQQVLCEQGMVERFLSSKEAAVVRKCFAAQYSLGSTATPESREAVENAIRDGSTWVLKPQREGGGNNLYGDELSAFLSKHRHDALLTSFVLMQRIFPLPQTSAMLRKGQLCVADTISELGVYGCFLGDGQAEAMLNEAAGYLLRTKQVGVDEGGVATGYSVLNSIVLVD